MGLAGLLLSGALLTFLYWLRECRPDACTIFNELVLVMVALDMVTLLEIILGGCVLTNNWWGALFWVVLIASLNLVAVAGQQRYCRLPRSGP